MPQYTLHYFGVYGRGEAIRMLLAHANADWADNKFGFDTWGALKPTMPNQQVPCLELANGKKYGQSNSILRFVGMKHGYYPTDPVQAAEADTLCDTYLDFFQKIPSIYFAGDAAKDGLMNDLFNNILPKFLDYINPLCAKG